MSPTVLQGKPDAIHMRQLLLIAHLECSSAHLKRLERRDCVNLHDSLVLKWEMGLRQCSRWRHASHRRLRLSAVGCTSQWR